MKDLKNKGISLITLSVSIVIILILTSIMIYNSMDGIHLGNLKKMQNDIELLSETIEIYYLENNELPKGTQCPTNLINGLENPNDSDYYYVIDLEKLEGISLNYGADNNKITSPTELINYNDVYVINEQSHQIYYIKGIELDEVIYYTYEVDAEKITLVEE